MKMIVKTIAMIVITRLTAFEARSSLLIVPIKLAIKSMIEAMMTGRTMIIKVMTQSVVPTMKRAKFSSIVKLNITLRP